MKQIIQNYKTGEIKLEEVPVPLCKAGGVLVKTVNSVISLGTERMIIDFARKNLIGKARERPDLFRQFVDSVKRQGFITTFKEAMNRLETSVPLGSSCSGIVLEVGEGVDDFQVGDRVACAGSGFANHAEVNFVPKNLCVHIPKRQLQVDKEEKRIIKDYVSFEEAAFVNLGAIALHGVRNANLTFGEKVGVIGLGLLGQIMVQILKGYGCEVIGIDIDKGKVALALKLGADVGAVSGKEDVSYVVHSFSKGYGLDAVIIAASSSSAEPIQLAAKISRERGRIVMVGVTKMEIERKIFYEKELDFKVSRSGGPGKYDPIYEERGIDYPIGYTRWTLRRNMEEFLNLIAKGKIKLEKIITHRVGTEEVVETYRNILGGHKRFIGIVISYPDTFRLDKKVYLKKNKAIPLSKEKIGVGVIGAGLFGRSILLPALKNISLISLKAIASATGTSAKTLGDKFGFEYATSNY
ncbi:oxidoreductase, partial [Methanosarcinales archaeon]